MKYNLTGQRFGKLTALFEQPERKNRKIVWHCKCDCGNECDVVSSYLISGHTQSCGCVRLSHGEEKIKTILSEHNIPFEQEKTFPSCINPLTNRPLRFDFFVDGQYLIKYDGEQHYKQVNTHWESLEKVQQRDRIKDAWCKEHNITLIRIPYTRLNTLTIEDLLPKKGR